MHWDVQISRHNEIKFRSDKIKLLYTDIINFVGVTKANV